MKIRNGFVSNSSSSSFLVIFPHAPASKEDIKDMLFGDGYTMDDLWDGNTLEELSQRIFSDCDGSTTDKEILETLEERLESFICSSLSEEYSWGSPPSIQTLCGTNRDLYTKAYIAYADYEEQQNDFNKLHDDLDAQFKLKFGPVNWKIESEVQVYWEGRKEFMNSQSDLIAADKAKEKTYKKALSAIKKCAKEDFEFLKKDNYNCFFLVAEYGDHERFGRTIEQCDVFRKVPHIRNNHH